MKKSENIQDAPVKKPHNQNYVIATVKKPMIWSRCDETENWLLNPPRGYILNASNVQELQPYVESISDLRTSTKYKPLDVKNPGIVGSRILVERCRERGIGDLLFMTGPLNFIAHMTGNDVKIDMYGLSERSQILEHHPALHHETLLYGPLTYQDLDLYKFHWFSDTVTEFSEATDQLNVYDALFRQIGVDPETVDPRYKRPTLTLTPDDAVNLNQMYRFVWMEREIDLRRTPYYVVSPLANATLRSMPYSTWLTIISNLSKHRPVIVLGNHNNGNIPAVDITFGAFNEELNKMGPAVINLMGTTPIRIAAGLIQKAVCLLSMDSGALYIAESLRTPAISFWGTHDPRVRIGYDAEYMQYAVWQKQACPASPCFAYSAFPAHLCPEKDNQRCCEVLKDIDLKTVFNFVNKIESNTRGRM